MTHFDRLTTFFAASGTMEVPIAPGKCCEEMFKATGPVASKTSEERRDIEVVIFIHVQSHNMRNFTESDAFIKLSESPLAKRRRYVRIFTVNNTTFYVNLLRHVSPFIRNMNVCPKTFLAEKGEESVRGNLILAKHGAGEYVQLVHVLKVL